MDQGYYAEGARVLDPALRARANTFDPEQVWMSNSSAPQQGLLLPPGMDVSQPPDDLTAFFEAVGIPDLGATRADADRTLAAMRARPDLRGHL